MMDFIITSCFVTLILTGLTTAIPSNEKRLKESFLVLTLISFFSFVVVYMFKYFA